MRAKLTIESVTKTAYSTEVIQFKAVPKSDGYPENGLDENNTFAKFSPNAFLQITIANPALLGKFQPGESYYVDFTKADK